MKIAPVMKTISLSQLTSSCMDAGWQGCQVIRSFHEAHSDSKGGKLKIGGDARSVVTQCDIDAQAKIIAALRSTWGEELLIIGEEDETEAGALSSGADAPPPLRTDILFDDREVQKTMAPGLDEEIPLEELALFVDPVDGTREFVEGRLGNVACLIGIARNSRPVAGIIGVPFPGGGDLSCGAEIHYAIADQKDFAGVWSQKETPPSGAGESEGASASASTNSDAAEQASNDESSDRDGHAAGTTVLSGDSGNPVLQIATTTAVSLAPGGDARRVIVGGTAAKLRMVATSTSPTVAVLHFDTQLWDTCAPEALLKCRGGKITDMFGASLVHCPKRTMGNVFGVVASSKGASVLHDELCRSMRADRDSVMAIFQQWIGEGMPPPGVSQSIDIARDLDGMPYGLDHLQELLRDENPTDSKLVGYSVPEEDAWRGLMSNGVRFQLQWEEGANPSGNSPPSDMFYKRIVMANLDHARDKLKTAPHKLVRDVKSYQVETSFLTSYACKYLVNDTGMKINKVLSSDLRPVAGDNPKELLDSSFSIFLEYFQNSDGWEQHWLLPREETKASLEELAKMHAYFWQGSDFWKKDGGKAGSDLENMVWPNGGYMQPKLQGYEQLKKVRSGWEARYSSFRDDLEKVAELKGVDCVPLGERLEEVAPIVGGKAHPFADKDAATNADFARYRTLIHGDPKHANFFFRKKQESGIEVGLIDFQWSGFGLAATDVAHHITSAVSSSALCFSGKEEGELLDHYYSCLTRELVKYGVGKDAEEIETSIFPRETLQQQYEVAFLDICRIVFAYAWRRWKAEDEPSEESFNRNAYNKSLDSVLWLITRCHVYLSKYQS
ncbi:unnamed protein product [Pseudo-nitzschia multistriata]|uniref:3'(2'),5'-bisphosphate nucleotidase n=1 Tax=Pseudo-nitzschia multistriata TaxID=183589 RepID=A0A448ZC16_9STRA|nr:unnamed protein product [Pseudo-nitzschia multistriata]